jgi:hypothetical protein
VTVSPVPAATDALLRLLSTAQGLRGVQIVDGEDIAYLSGSAIVVGADGESDIAGDASSFGAGFGARSRQDTVSLTCLIWSSSGDARLKPRRDEAFGWFDTVRDLIAVNTDLAGPGTFAEVTAYTYRPRRDERGVGVAVEFTVQLTAV